MKRLHRGPLPSLLSTLLVIVGCAAPQKQALDRENICQGQAPATPVTTVHYGPIRVGAWNIEWLGTPERRSGPARSHPQSPEALAEYILAADVDVLGLEEVKIDAEDGSDTNRALRQALAIVERERGGRWQHRLFATSYGRDQCTGIAWDAARVRPLDEPRVVTDPRQVSAQGKRLWSRPPRGVLFSAGRGLTDFVVVVVHMKSDYGGDFALHRGEEAQHLAGDLPDVFDDPDVMIVGDTNCDSHSEPAIVALTAAGFVDLNADDIATHWRYGALDRALVPADQPEFARRCFEVLSDSYLDARDLKLEDFKVDYSDHFMVITEVDVMPDDD
jgi:hypothetical protein